MKTEDYIALENKYLANNYAPLPVVLSKSEDCWLYDIEGNKYLDFLSAYSAVSAGHLNKRIRKALENQLDKLDVPSRAFRTDTLGIFAEKICNLSGFEKVLPMNTGAEAVETAIKAARRWGYRNKCIPDNKAEIIVSENNFHGRTTTICGFSSEEDYKKDFGPFDNSFRTIPFGDSKALEKSITPYTCAYITEPIQGETGIIIPPQGWLREIQRICKENNVLLILDEIQSGLGRTGKNFAFDHEIDRPDGLILGKALGGGIYPVSAFLSDDRVMQNFTPGSHGSTFGGNPLAAAIAIEALNILEDSNLIQNSATLGNYLKEKLIELNSPYITEIRGIGLWIGIDIDTSQVHPKSLCEKLKNVGILCKDTHGKTIRFAPPLTIKRSDIDWALDKIKSVFC